MYNGIGLTTARGSGTNGYVQTNKFFVRAKVGRVAGGTSKGFEADQGTAGVTRKPNKEILEHDRKRQIELKLVVLEDKLIDQGYTDAEIAERLAEARKTLEAASAAADDTAVLVGDKKVSDTQTHQIAARKEKQMETLRAALGIRSSEPEEQNTDEVDEEAANNQKSDIHKHKIHEHAFLDRDHGRKKSVEENKKLEKEEKKKNDKHSKRKSKEHSGNRRHGDDSSDTNDSFVRSRASKKRHRKINRRSDVEDSDTDIEKKRKASKKLKKTKRNASDDSDSSSFTGDDSDSASSYDSSDSDGSERYSKGVKKKHRRTQRGSDEEDKKHKVSKKHRKNKNDSEEDSASSDDDARKHSSRKQVEKSKKPHRRHDLDDGSSSDVEGLLKEKQHLRSKRRHDSDEESDSDNGMKKKSNRVEEERKKNYKRSDDRKYDLHSDSSSDEEGLLNEKQHKGTRGRHDSESERETKKKIRQVERVREDRKQNSKKFDSSSDEEGLLKEQQPKRSVGRYDSEDDKGVRNKNSRVESKQIRRPEYDSGSDEDLRRSRAAKGMQPMRTGRRQDTEVEYEPNNTTKKRNSQSEEERKQNQRRRTLDENSDDEDRSRSKVGVFERSKRKPDVSGEETSIKHGSRMIERSQRSVQDDRRYNNPDVSSDEKMEKRRDRRYYGDDEEPDTRDARNVAKVNVQKSIEKRLVSSDTDVDDSPAKHNQHDLEGGTRGYDHKRDDQIKPAGERNHANRDDMSRRVGRRSPQEDFRSRRGDERRRETRDSDDERYRKNDPKESASVRRGRHDERRDEHVRNYRNDDEPHRINRTDRDARIDKEEDRGRKHGRDEDEYKQRSQRKGDYDDYHGSKSQRRKDEERDNRDSDRDRRDYPKRPRYDDSREKSVRQ